MLDSNGIQWRVSDLKSAALHLSLQLSSINEASLN